MVWKLKRTSVQEAWGGLFGKEALGLFCFKLDEWSKVTGLLEDFQKFIHFGTCFYVHSVKSF